MKFYRCDRCGNVVALATVGGGTLSCCGQAMTELVPNTQDGAKEKHVPVAKVVGSEVEVQVGEVLHPMIDVHYIEWIYLLTDKGGSFHFLKPGMEPKTVFALAEGEKPLEVYAYCNKHGLYSAKIA